MNSGNSFFDGFFFVMATLGMLGAFVDFIVGKRGQKKIRDKLIDWWAILSDVRWHNFGKEEATAALDILDAIAGARLFSLRRLVVSCIVVGIAAAFGAAAGLYVAGAATHPSPWSDSRLLQHWQFDAITAVLMVAISISITRFLSSLIVRLGNRGNAVWFLLLVVLQIAVLILWPPLVFGLRITTTYLLTIAGLFMRGEFSVALSSIDRFFYTLPVMTSYLRVEFLFIWYAPLESILKLQFGLHNPCDEAGCATWTAFRAGGRAVDFMAAGGRLLFALFFFSSYLFRPVIQRPLTLLLERLVESEKPICTLTFGGLAAVAKLIQEGAKNIG